MSGLDWEARYRDLVAALPRMVAEAGVTLCGLGACIDARVLLQDIGPMLDAAVPEAVALGRLLQARAAEGKGGELAFAWPGGPAWLAGHVPLTFTLGGTGPHAASALSALEAPALLALEDRSAPMLRGVPGDVLLADGDAVVRAAEIVPSGPERPKVYIFEYTAGTPVGDVVPSRSSRIIVRFADLGLEHDAAFDRVSVELAGRAGAGLVSGFTAVPSGRLEAELRRVADLVAAWRDAGLATVHLELAGYDAPAQARQVIDAMRGRVTSVGMSESEFIALHRTPRVDRDALIDFGDRMAVDRVCVHADRWAACVTRRDPEVESSALLTGYLLASARASAGRPTKPTGLDPSALFEEPPFEHGPEPGRWRLAACASPYIRRPETTLGLGDAFTAGCLLALGGKPAMS